VKAHLIVLVCNDILFRVTKNLTLNQICWFLIAPVVLEEICKDLARKNELKGKTLELLITASLHSLDLSDSILGSHSIPYFLSLTLKKCPVINIGTFYSNTLHYNLYSFFSTTACQMFTTWRICIFC
jgi:hypothetical protein